MSLRKLAYFLDHILLESYSGGPVVQISAQRPAILIEVFRGLLNPSRQMPGEYLKLGHGLPHTFQFIIHLPFHRRSIVWATESVIKWTTNDKCITEKQRFYFLVCLHDSR
jgi:hypothetical protein